MREPSAPPGWYPVGGEQRYWDGQQWTDHRAPVASPATPHSPAGGGVGKTALKAFARGLLGRPEPQAQRGQVQSAPSVSDLVAGCTVIHGEHPLDEQVEVVGETYAIKGIKKVFREVGMPITRSGSTLEEIDCCLVPEPWNEHDSNAVAVCVLGHRVGYLPAELAGDYATSLGKFVRKHQLVGGSSRIWAKDDGGVVRARVTVLIPEANLLR